jgi:hypothetical protein
MKITPSVHTTTRRMDQRLRTRNRAVPIANGRDPTNHEVPASQQWNPEVYALHAHSV